MESPLAGHSFEIAHKARIKQALSLYVKVYYNQLHQSTISRRWYLLITVIILLVFANGNYQQNYISTYISNKQAYISTVSQVHWHLYEAL